MTNQTTLPIDDTIKTAWHKIDGAKGSIWAAFILAEIITMGLSFISGFFKPLDQLILVLSSLLSVLMQFGLYYIGIQRAANAPINYQQMFHVFSGITPINIILLIILQILIFILPAALAIIPTVISQHSGLGYFNPGTMIAYITAILLAIYLACAISLSMGYVIAKNMGPFSAIQASFHATKGHILELVLIYLLFTLIILLLCIPFFLGLIWGIPFTFVLYGEVYKRLTAENT